MSLYSKYAQGAPVKTGFDLTVDNIDEYLRYTLNLYEDVKWVNHVCDLEYKLTHHHELTDELYTIDFLNRRISTLMNKIPEGLDFNYVKDLKSQLTAVNADINRVKPLVFDPVEGQKVENHEKMSQLDDKRKELLEKINDFYGERYPLLKEHLPKIYYMVIEGVDITTVELCFQQMKRVLKGTSSCEQATDVLMKDTSKKYGLPSSIWDPIRLKGNKRR